MRYICDPHVIPTIVPRDLQHIADYVREIAPYAPGLHIDVADGAFASNVSWPLLNPFQMQEVEQLKELVQLPAHFELEVHFMTHNPAEFGDRFAKAGFTRITAHVEAFEGDRAREALDRWSAAGAAVGLAIKIDTPLSALADAAPSCDFLQVMSIAEIGSQGHAFDERALSRVEELHATYPDMMVAVDGGVSEATVEELVRAGANRLLVGSALAESATPEVTYARIHERAMQGCEPVKNREYTLQS